MEKDKRIQKILDQLTKFAAGDFSAVINVSEKKDDVDTIITGLNAFGETLKVQANEWKEKRDKINSLLDILLKYSLMDPAMKALVDTGDDIDFLGAGLSVLGEELAQHTIKLRDSQEQIETIFKNAPDAVVIVDSRGAIVRWNPAAETTFGWYEKEATGNLLHNMIIPEGYRARYEAEMSHFLNTGKGWLLNKSLQLPALRKDNSEIQIELTISPAKLQDKYLFIAFVRDVTERKKAEEQIIQLNTTLEQRVIERTDQLNQSEKKYRNLFENNPMPMWVLEIPSLRFLDVNEAAIFQYGYSKDEFLSMTAVDIRPEKDKKRFVDLDRSNKGPQKAGVWQHLRKDGTLIFAEVSVHEISIDGRRARLVLSSDVTEKKKTEEALRNSESRFRKIFESKLIGFVFWDADGDIIEANDVFLDMVGYSRLDLAERKIKWIDIASPEYAAADRRAAEQLQTTGICEPFEKEYLRKDGSRLPVLVGAAVIYEAIPEKGVAYIVDVSQRKKMQEEILELNRSLEVRVIKRTQELQEANKELESFSYSVSHDLRAPLRAIHGYSQILIEDYESKLDQEGMRLLNNVKFNAKRMGQLVDDLLAFSRMGKCELNQMLVSMNEIVEDVLQEVHPHDKARTAIEVHALGEARADPALLRHVFQNMVLNAVKYSSKKESPTIEIGVTEIKGTKAYFVKDNGAGFDMRYYNKLFGVFQRLHRQEEFEGTGVGLAIIQRIVLRHGGHVWAEGKVNEGATFYFTLNSKPKE